jgi:hypothetical protein
MKTKELRKSEPQELHAVKLIPRKGTAPPTPLILQLLAFPASEHRHHTQADEDWAVEQLA